MHASTDREIVSLVSNRRILQASVKRIIDVTLSMIVLILSFPVMLIVAFSIKVDTPGPVFFNSVRVGLRGKHFVMYKFRTMVADAEERLKDLQTHNRGGSLLIKIPNDPRVTRVGRILRKFSLDELPQFVNVLKGNMSLVGPRPQYPREVAHYTEDQKRRLEVPPGITGLWQVSARESSDFDEWVRLDLEYIENWSLLLDLRILLLTIPAVLKGTGD